MKTLSLFLTLLVASSAFGRTVVVTTYPELYSACQTALSGDTIVVAKGTYTINDGKNRIYISNCEGPVLVKGETGYAQDVIVEGLGQDSDAVEMVFNLDNCPKWTFEAMTVRNSYYHGFKFDHGSTDCVLRNLLLLNHGSAAIKGTSDPVAKTYPDNLLVEQCIIGYTSSKGGTRDVVEGLDAVGIKGWTISHNVFFNIKKTGGDGIAYGCFTKGNSINTMIDNNRFEDCFIGASLGGGGTAPAFFRDSDQTYEQRYGIIVNNLFVHCTDAAIYVNKTQDARLYHNTVFECGLTMQLRFKETTGEVVNNLVMRSPDNPNEPPLRLRDSATTTMDTMNLIATAADFVGTTGASSDIDLHLRPTSAAIDNALCLFASPFDFDGVSRFNAGKGCDVGAYEYVAAFVGPTQQPQSQLTAYYDYEMEAVFVTLQAISPLQVTIYDLLGRIVKYYPSENTMWGKYCYYLPELANGTYLAVITSSVGGKTIQFSVAK